MNTKKNIFEAGYASYPANDNPYHPRLQRDAWERWDRGYWQAHDDSYVPDTGGIEEGYGDFYDFDAVSQGFYDDDPNPYSGTYSEM